ncbi:type II toxin-antitoxin system RelE/ParE family toxin [Thermodesulfobacteriota bacterium]
MIDKLINYVIIQIIMEKFYRPPFRKFVKKRPRPFQLVIEDEVENIEESPEIGDPKKGGLKVFRAHKFSFQNKKYLIAYRLKEAEIVFYLIGPHENFYIELKRYIKEAGI